MASFASSATTCSARKHAWTNNGQICFRPPPWVAHTSRLDQCFIRLHIHSRWVKICVPLKISFLGTPEVGEKQRTEDRKLYVLIMASYDCISHHTHKPSGPTLNIFVHDEESPGSLPLAR